MRQDPARPADLSAVYLILLHCPGGGWTRFRDLHAVGGGGVVVGVHWVSSALVCGASFACSYPLYAGSTLSLLDPLWPGRGDTTSSLGRGALTTSSSVCSCVATGGGGHHVVAGVLCAAASLRAAAQLAREASRRRPASPRGPLPAALPFLLLDLPGLHPSGPLVRRPQRCPLALGGVRGLPPCPLFGVKGLGFGV